MARYVLVPFLGGVDLELVLVVGVALLDVLGDCDVTIGRDVGVIEQVGVKWHELVTGPNWAVNQ